MGKLETSFGRNEKELGDLEELLRESSHPKINALVVGAGLDNLPVFGLMPDHVKAEQPLWLQKQYGWEYLEVAAVLERLGKPWTLIVVDSSLEVCEALKRQEDLVIDNIYGQKKERYTRRFLATFGVNSYDNEELRRINAILEPTIVSNRVTILKRLYIPSAIRERIAILHGDVRSLDDLELPHGGYDIITMFNVAEHLSHDGREKAGRALGNRLAKGGIIVTDFEVYGLQGIKPPKIFEWDNYGEWRRYTIYFLGKPQAATARIPLRA